MLGKVGTRISNAGTLSIVLWCAWSASTENGISRLKFVSWPISERKYWKTFRGPWRNMSRMEPRPSGSAGGCIDDLGGARALSSIRQVDGRHFERHFFKDADERT